MPGLESPHQIQAILRIQWLSMKNRLRRRSERFGVILTTLVTLLWYGFWTAGAIGLFFFVMWAPDSRLVRALPPLLFFVLLYWQATPLLTASMGISIDLRKMAVYPIEVKTLFLVECLLRLLTGLEMLLLLAGVSVGMMVRNPRGAPVFLPALALFVMFNILLSAGLRQVLERLLQRRGFRHFFVFVMVMASALPQLMLWAESGHQAGQRVYRVFRLLPPSVLPTTPLADAYLGQTSAWDWALLAAWCAAAGAFGFLQFRRSFYFDFAAARTAALRPKGRNAWAERLYRLPGFLLPDPVAALIERELRYLSRSPRFRFLFLMACTFGVVAWLPFAMRRSTGGPFQSSFLTVLSLYGLLMLGQVIFMNSFGLDRSSARFFFWMPVSPSLLLLAKNLAGAVFIGIQVGILALICFLLRTRVGPWQVLEAFAVTAISALYLMSAGNFMSVLIASGLSPDRISRGGAGRSLQGLYVLLYPVLISPVIAAYIARYYWHSLHGYILLLGIAAVGGLALYAATLPLAARIGYLRREALLQELSRGEGPLVEN